MRCNSSWRNRSNEWQHRLGLRWMLALVALFYCRVEPLVNYGCCCMICGPRSYDGQLWFFFFSSEDQQWCVLGVGLSGLIL